MRVDFVVFLATKRIEDTQRVFWLREEKVTLVAAEMLFNHKRHKRGLGLYLVAVDGLVEWVNREFARNGGITEERVWLDRKGKGGERSIRMEWSVLIAGVEGVAGLVYRFCKYDDFGWFAGGRGRLGSGV